MTSDEKTDVNANKSLYDDDREFIIKTIEAIKSDKTQKIIGINRFKENSFIKYQAIAPPLFSTRGVKFLKTEEEIVNAAAAFGIKREDCYCRICGKLLINEKTLMWISSYGNKYNLVTNNKHNFLNVSSYNTDDQLFRLSVCDDCLKEKFKDYRPDDRFQIFAHYAQFAMNVPDNIFKQYKSDNYGSNSLEHFISVYGETEGPIKYDEYLEKIAMTLDNQIKKHGEEEGRKRWDAYCKRQALTNTFEYKNQKYGMTREEFDEYNKSRAVTKENLIKRHGKKEGIKIWEDYRRKQRYSVTLNYFIETNGEEEGQKNIITLMLLAKVYLINSQKSQKNSAKRFL